MRENCKLISRRRQALYLKKTMTKPESLSSNLYNKEYYRRSLPGSEYLNRKDIIDPAIEDTIQIGQIKPGSYVLDYGTGRGTLPIALAERGSRVLGLDFSQDAIDFAREYIKKYPIEVQKQVDFKRMDASEFNFKSEFDVIVFNQVYEHLYDWELEILISKFRQALKPGGTLVISTPNLNYVRFLFPVKRTLELPFKIAKETIRVLRGKSKHTASFGTFLKEIFKIAYPESEHTRLHINLQTPESIKQFVTKQGFRVHVECVDRHKNLISILMRPWWGETIWLRGISS